MPNDDVGTEEDVAGEVNADVEQVDNMCPYISLNALSGITAYQTMRVKGVVGKKVILILIDSGSTHNFLDIKTAKQLGCKLVSTCPLKITVPGEHNLVSNNACNKFKWTLQGHEYSTDVMLLSLGGCDMVLGIQWPSTLGNIRWNFKQRTMEFFFQGTKRILKGIQQSAIHCMNDKQMEKEMVHSQAELSCMALCVFPIVLFQMDKCETEQPVNNQKIT